MMNGRTVTKRTLASLTVVAMLASCAAESTVPPSSTTPAAASTAPLVSSMPAAAAPSPGVAAHWSLVSISDSVFGSGDEDHLEAVDAYAAGIERDLGVKVTVHGYWLGGHTSDQVLRRIQSDSVLRAALASADVIVFEVPIGEFRFECPFDNAEWHPLTGTPTEWWTCTARAAARNTANAGRIMDAIVALRSPADALILASNLWEIGYRANLAQGIEPQMHALFTAANAGVEAAATSRGIPVADAWTAFMGPDGTTDPVATGDLLDDMSHLTPQGAAKLASVWRVLGYEKRRTVASRPAATPSPATSPVATGTPFPTATGSPPDRNGLAGGFSNQLWAGQHDQRRRDLPGASAPASPSDRPATLDGPVQLHGDDQRPARQRHRDLVSVAPGDMGNACRRCGGPVRSTAHRERGRSLGRQGIGHLLIGSR